MRDSPLDHFVVGIILAVSGLAVIVFHQRIKAWRDYWSSKDFPLGYGGMWSGKYTRGGLIFTYVVIILAGAILFVSGILQLANAFK